MGQILRTNKILIIANKLIGDNIDAINSVHSLVKYYKGGEFHLLGYSYSLDIFNEVVNPKKVIPLSQDKNYQEISYWDMPQLLQLVKSLYQEKYDLVFILPGGFFYALITFLSRIKIRVGHKGDFRTLLLTHSNPKDQKIANYQNYDNLLSAVPENIPGGIPLVHYQLEGESFNLKDFKLTKPYMVISPMASENNKIWSHKNFRALCQQVKEELSLQVVLVGLAAERETIAKISDGNGSINLAGKLNLKQVFYLIKNGEFYLGNDSGLAHVAGHLGIKCLVLMGPSNAILSKPRGNDTHLLLPKNSSPIPYHKRKKKKYAKEFAINKISVGEVFSKIKEIGGWGEI